MDLITEAAIIFGLRVLGIAVSTLATLMTVQGRKFYAMIAGFISALVYVLAIGKVVTDLSNIWNVLAYAAGFSVGTLVGMAWEQRMSLGFAEVRFISVSQSERLAEALRQAGFGVTEMYGRGRDQAVGIVQTIVPRRNVDTVLKIGHDVDDHAITSVAEARTVYHGYWTPARR